MTDGATSIGGLSDLPLVRLYLHKMTNGALVHAPNSGHHLSQMSSIVSPWRFIKALISLITR